MRAVKNSGGCHRLGRRARPRTDVFNPIGLDPELFDVLTTLLRSADPVAQTMNTGFPGAVRAAEITAIDFHAVADDPVLAMYAYRRERGDRAFKTVESMSPARHCYVERFVVVVAALFTSCHWGPLVGTAIRFRKSVLFTAVPQHRVGHAKPTGTLSRVETSALGLVCCMSSLRQSLHSRL
jgi:hypothetical protein